MRTWVGVWCLDNACWRNDLTCTLFINTFMFECLISKFLDVMRKQMHTNINIRTCTHTHTYIFTNIQECWGKHHPSFGEDTPSKTSGWTLLALHPILVIWKMINNLNHTHSHVLCDCGSSYE